MKKGTGKGIFLKFVLPIIIILLVLFIFYYNFSSSVCVEREVSGNNVNLKITLSALHKPTSFIIEESASSNQSITNYNIAPTVYNEETKRATWIFGNSFLDVKSTALSYTLSESSSEYAELVSAEKPGYPELGYSRKTLSSGGKTCI